MKKLIASGCVVALLVMGLAGCEKKNGDAIVIGKDYVAAMKQGEALNDGRATNHEQWIVKVRMLDNGRRIEVRADRAQWENCAKTSGSKSRIA